MGVLGQAVAVCLRRDNDFKPTAAGEHRFSGGSVCPDEGNCSVQPP